MLSASHQLLFIYTTRGLCVYSAFHILKCHFFVYVSRKVFLCKIVEVSYKIKVFLAYLKQSQKALEITAL